MDGETEINNKKKKKEKPSNFLTKISMKFKYLIQCSEKRDITHMHDL